MVQPFGKNWAALQTAKCKVVIWASSSTPKYVPKRIPAYIHMYYHILDWKLDNRDVVACLKLPPPQISRSKTRTSLFKPFLKGILCARLRDELLPVHEFVVWSGWEGTSVYITIPQIHLGECHVTSFQKRWNQLLSKMTFSMLQSSCQLLFSSH